MLNTYNVSCIVLVVEENTEALKFSISSSLPIYNEHNIRNREHKIYVF